MEAYSYRPQSWHFALFYFTQTFPSESNLTSKITLRNSVKVHKQRIAVTNFQKLLFNPRNRIKRYLLSGCLLFNPRKGKRRSSNIPKTVGGRVQERS
jgi:hypothetical protein